MARVEKGAVYKIKEGKSYDSTEEILTPYVRVVDYASNSTIQEYNDSWYILLVYVFKDSLECTSNIHPLKVVKYEDFLEYFEVTTD